MYAHVSREEWIWRGLAIATILALVGLAVLLVAVGIGDVWVAFRNYYYPVSGNEGMIIDSTFIITSAMIGFVLGDAIGGPVDAVVGLVTGIAISL